MQRKDENSLVKDGKKYVKDIKRECLVWFLCLMVYKNL